MKAMTPGKNGSLPEPSVLKRLLANSHVVNESKPHSLSIERSGVPAEVRILADGYDGDSAMKLYLREIGKTPLLTPTEEIKLAAKIKIGDQVAREQMIKANLRLVISIAKDYTSCGLPLLDLINEGNIGLMKAVKKFDPSLRKGAKFSTYGSWWIKQSIIRALGNQSRTIRIPVHSFDKIAHIRKAGHRLHEELGREPSSEELAEEMGMTVKRVNHLLQSALPTTSLATPIGEDGTGSFGDTVEDSEARTPYEQLETKATSGFLHEVVSLLDSREATIIRLRFGLDDGCERTLEEVGKKYSVTRERVRQIQNKALIKLRRALGRRGIRKGF